MSDEPLLTVDAFLESRFELPEGGQWAELESGRVSLFQPPEFDHGTAILNLSKAIAAWIALSETLYACFDLGLVLQREPATVRFPAVSFFAGGERFSESDHDATETVPVAVVDFASSSDRREVMPDRVRDYLHWGVPLVWVIDPTMKFVERVDPSGTKTRIDGDERLIGDGPLTGLEMMVSDLFAEPEWWSRPGPRSPRPPRR